MLLQQVQWYYLHGQRGQRHDCRGDHEQQSFPPRRFPHDEGVLGFAPTNLFFSLSSAGPQSPFWCFSGVSKGLRLRYGRLIELPGSSRFSLGNR